MFNLEKQEDTTMKKYIEPSIRVADMASEKEFMTPQSYDWADVKKKNFEEEDDWDEEEEEVTLEQVTGIPSRTTGIWNKKW